MPNNDLWKNLTRAADIELTEDAIALLHRYIDLLLEANQTMNLTRIAQREDAEIRHVADALTVLPHLPKEAIHLADVGSGGGIPGIPLAIVRNDMQVVLVESTRKKADFLRATAHTLNLRNVEVVNARIEDVAHSARRESFGIVTARAVAAMNVLLEWCLPLLKKNGKLIAMKGEKVNEELLAANKAIKILGGGKRDVHPVQLPGVDHHVLVVVTKTAKSPPKYPRNPSQVNSQPL